ncbi:MAG TPA: hypothetical protein VME42_21750 [Steroidobacteraceae bacterium]|nr:hypothetical protein [Steroidobacteraceae bacterium]
MQSSIGNLGVMEVYRVDAVSVQGSGGFVLNSRAAAMSGVAQSHAKTNRACCFKTDRAQQIDDGTGDGVGAHATCDS